MNGKPQGRKLKITSLNRFYVTFLISTVIVTVLAFSFEYQRFVLQRVKLQSAESLRLALASKVVARSLEEIATDIHWLAQSTAMTDYLNSQDPKNVKRVEQEFLNLIKNSNMYDQIRILGQKGRELVRINFNNGSPKVVSVDKLQDKSDRYYFKSAITLGRERIYISPLDLNVDNGVIEQPPKPMIRFAMPLYIENQNAPVGVLVLNHLAGSMLKNFEQMMTGSWGTPMILNQQGYWLYTTEHQKEWGFMKNNPETFGVHYPAAWHAFTSRQSGIFRNSKGLFIFDSLRPYSNIGDSKEVKISTSETWKVASHIPPEALKFSFWKTLTNNQLSAMTLLLLTTLSSYFISRMRTAHIENLRALEKKDMQHRNLFENMADGYALQEALFDENGKPYDFRYIEINSAFERILNVKRADVIGKTVLELFPDVEPYWMETFSNVAVTGKPGRLEQYGGSFDRYFEIAATCPAHGFVAIIFSDVTERKRTEEQLRQAAVVFNNTTEAVMVTDANAKVISVNKAFTKVTGFELDDVRGQDPNFQKSGKHDDAFYQDLWRSLKENGQWQGEIWNRRKDGVLYPVWENISVVKDTQGNITHYISVFSDISSIKQTELKLSHLAHHDSLTGLANRLAYSANLEQALERAQRHKQKVALLFLDLDRFKIINDTLGHAAGDRVLQVTAERLRKSVRAQDVVSRLGGDEFTIILEELSNIKDVENLATKIIGLVSEPIRLEEQELTVSASIGISIYPDDADNAQDLSKAGDAAMYSAKSRGRQTFAFFAAELDYADLS